MSADVRVEHEGASGGNVRILGLYDDAGARQVSLYRQNRDRDLMRVAHGGTYASTTGKLQLNTWARVRIRAVAAGDGAGTLEVFVDGTEVYRTTTANLPAAGLKTLQIGNENPRQAFVLVADDVAARR